MIDKDLYGLLVPECRMSNQASGTPANHQTASGMSGQQTALTNNLPSSVNSVGGQPTNSLSFNSETQVPLDLEGKVSNIMQKVLDKKRLCELVKEVDPAEQLDEDVEDVLLQVSYEKPDL